MTLGDEGRFGMITPDRWRTASYSGGSGGNCVEVRADLDAIRDSKNPAGPILGVSVAGLVESIKADTLR